MKFVFYLKFDSTFPKIIILRKHLVSLIHVFFFRIRTYSNNIHTFNCHLYFKLVIDMKYF